jgi:nucleoside-diphosphate-sugar epimerase
MRVAITGVSGFLGGALAKAYRQRGDSVVALARKTANVTGLAELGIELVYGELTEENSFHVLLKNADLGIHCAALTSDFGAWDEFLKINVGGPKNFFEAGLKQGCQKLIYVYGNGKHHRGTDEDAPYETLIIDNYTRSKILAEKSAYNYIQKNKLPLTIIRPGYIWGVGDRAIMPLMVEAIKTGRIGVIDGGVNLLNLAHIDNVVQGIMLAAGNEKAISQAYNLTDGSKVTTRRFFEDLIKLIGVECKLRSFPYVPVYSAAYLCEMYARMRRYKVKPLLTRYTVRMGKYDQVFNISKAIYELGYKPEIQYKDGMASLASYVQSLYYGQK